MTETTHCGVCGQDLLGCICGRPFVRGGPLMSSQGHLANEGREAVLPLYHSPFKREHPIEERVDAAIARAVKLATIYDALTFPEGTIIRGSIVHLPTGERFTINPEADA